MFFFSDVFCVPLYEFNCTFLNTIDCRLTLVLSCSDISLVLEGGLMELITNLNELILVFILCRGVIFDVNSLKI